MLWLKRTLVALGCVAVASVATPKEVPFSRTVAPGSGLPSASLTSPVILTLSTVFVSWRFLIITTSFTSVYV